MVFARAVLRRVRASLVGKVLRVALNNHILSFTRFSGPFVSSRHVLGSIVVSISACHAEDPGSIPGRGVFFPVLLLSWRGHMCARRSFSEILPGWDMWWTDEKFMMAPLPPTERLLKTLVDEFSP